MRPCVFMFFGLLRSHSKAFRQTIKTSMAGYVSFHSATTLCRSAYVFAWMHGKVSTIGSFVALAIPSFPGGAPLPAAADGRLSTSGEACAAGAILLWVMGDGCWVLGVLPFGGR